MSYEGVFTKIKEISVKADASRVEEHLAFRFNITGEGEGVFYIKVESGVLRVEPYKYYSRDAKLIRSADAPMRLAPSKLDPVSASTTGKLKVEESLEKVLMLQMFA